MPESTDGDDAGVDADAGAAGFDDIADELYALPPDEFVPARDDRVAAAKEAGDRDLARALARLRRPTKAAWLANLLARHRTEQLDGLVALARSLAQAQQELDGDALRALSGQRHRAVAAMARDAGRLAARRGETVNDALVREVAGILDAALADPGVAEEVRSGRLTKTVRYSGFGPAEGSDSDDDMAAWAASAPQRHGRRPGADGQDADDTGSRRDGSQEAPAAKAAGKPASDRAASDRAERERAERERAERERLAAERKARAQELADAEAEEADARSRQESDEADRDRADARHAAARDKVTELAQALDAARDEEQAALEAFRAAATAARDSARKAGAAAVRTARARTRLEQLPAQV